MRSPGLAIVPLLVASSCVAAPLSLQFKSGANLGSSTQDQNGVTFPVAGLSGLSWTGPEIGGGGSTYMAVMDNSNKLVRLSISITSDGTISSASLLPSGGLSLSDSRDFEDIAFRGTARDAVYLCEEGSPEIREYRLDTGALVRVLSRPAIFANRRSNFGFESLSLNRTQSALWTANEEALTNDGSASTPSTGTWVRLLRYDAAKTPPTPVAQFAYQTQPMHGSVISGARSGVSQVVALPNGKLLVLERSFAFGATLFQTRIYEFDVASATDVSGLTTLVGTTYTPATKRLLYSGDQTNLEGLCLGPKLPDGSYALLGIVDDGDPISVNRVVSFRLSGSIDSACPADLNDDSVVDDADFVRFAESYNLLLDPVGDLNHDGLADDEDFVLFAAAYNELACAT
ncbi:MAG: esterase-like activity of phytase family protein [Phycisphaerales bacterium]|nr:esterase-like activity of phytase family protein [Phycisphaerales bacterium]